MRAINKATVLRRAVLILCGAGIVLAVAWSVGGLAGSPALPLSDKAGTQCTYPISEAHVIAAITNALGLARYNEMMLTEAVAGDWLAEGWHPTNGFLLRPTLEPTAHIPTKGLLGRRQLPYLAWFHITTTPIGQSGTTVSVRTVLAKVVDGVALGHAGTTGGTVKVAPVRREEERVLAAISDQIAKENERN
jgi:hypothetical protein